MAYFSRTTGAGSPSTIVRQICTNNPPMHGVISPMMISPVLHDAIRRRMKRLVMMVGDDHAEVVFGAEIAHAVLDDRGELEFLQSGTRIIVQRL